MDRLGSRDFDLEVNDKLALAMECDFQSSEKFRQQKRAQGSRELDESKDSNIFPLARENEDSLKIDENKRCQNHKRK